MTEAAPWTIFGTCWGANSEPTEKDRSLHMDRSKNDVYSSWVGEYWSRSGVQVVFLIVRSWIRLSPLGQTALETRELGQGPDLLCYAKCKSKRDERPLQAGREGAEPEGFSPFYPTQQVYNHDSSLRKRKQEVDWWFFHWASLLGGGRGWRETRPFSPADNTQGVREDSLKSFCTSYKRCHCYTNMTEGKMHELWAI